MGSPARESERVECRRRRSLVAAGMVTGRRMMNVAAERPRRPMPSPTLGVAVPRAAPRQGKVPPLQPGDRLTRDEFERRFDATPGLKKAELIEGTVLMPPPPVSQENHSSPHFDLIWWLGMYRAATPGVEGGDNGSLRL